MLVMPLRGDLFLMYLGIEEGEKLRQDIDAGEGV